MIIQLWVPDSFDAITNEALQAIIVHESVKNLSTEENAEGMLTAVDVRVITTSRSSLPVEEVVILAFVPFLPERMDRINLYADALVRESEELLSEDGAGKKNVFVQAIFGQSAVMYS